MPTIAPMQRNTPTQPNVHPPMSEPTSTEFRRNYTAFDDNSALNAQNSITKAVEDAGAVVSQIQVEPAMLESLPPQGVISGRMYGSTTAVYDALEAIKALDI